MAELVRDGAGRIVIHPDAGAAAPTADAGAARAAGEADDDGVEIAAVVAELAGLLAGVRVLEAEGVEFLAETLGRILLHIPRLVVRELDRRRDGGVHGEAAVGGLVEKISDVAHDLVAFRLRGRDGVLIRKGEREVEHPELAEGGGGRGGERAGETLRAAGDTFALQLELRDLLLEQRDVAAVAEIDDLPVGLDGHDGFLDGRRRRGGERGLAGDGANLDGGFAGGRKFADLEPAKRTLVDGERAVEGDAVEGGIGQPAHGLRAAAVNMGLIGGTVRELRVARDGRLYGRGRIERGGLIDAQVGAAPDAFLELGDDLGGQLLACGHGDGLPQGLARMADDQRLEDRAAGRRELHALGDQGGAVGRRGGEVALGPRLKPAER